MKQFLLGLLIVLVHDLDRDANCQGFFKQCRPHPPCPSSTLAALRRVESLETGCCDVEGDVNTGWMLCAWEEIVR